MKVPFRFEQNFEMYFFEILHPSFVLMYIFSYSSFVSDHITSKFIPLHRIRYCVIKNTN